MKKPAIIILHGWGSSSEAWQAPKELLEKHGFSVYIPDLPGFGKEPPPKRPWSVSDYVDFVLEYAGKNGLDKFCLIGHSFGGRIAIKLAALYPEKLTSLVLTGVPVRTRKSFKVLTFNFLAKIGKILFLIPPLPFFAPWARKILYTCVGEWDYYKTEGVMRQTFKKIINENLSPFLQKINLPTLILWGEEDKVIPLETAYHLKEKIPQAELKIIKGGNHRFPYEQPEIFVKYMI
ncbi:alpha/beta hydrolase [Candidatus Gottesmanbacteria bacterium]|nr:alpha/beta hydrolase [Candidatus Gottesmanbacteria bacterium]